MKIRNLRLALTAVVGVTIWAGYTIYNRIAEARSGSNGREHMRDTGLAHLPDKEIQNRAKDKSLPKAERRRYQTEEKARKLRNREKRSK